MLVAQHLRRSLLALEAAGQLRGEVVLLPACNPIGLTQQVWGRLQGRFELASGQNFNRQYPDLAAGAAARFLAAGSTLRGDAQADAQALRAALREELAAQPAASALQQLRHGLLRLALEADVVLDLHCDNEAVLHVYGTPQHEASASQLAQCLQAPLLLLAEDSGDGPFDEALSMLWPRLRARLGPGVPLACFAATVELRGETDVSHELAAADAAGLLRFLEMQGFVAAQETPLEDSAFVAAVDPAGYALVHPAEHPAGHLAGDPAVLPAERPAERPIEGPVVRSAVRPVEGPAVRPAVRPLTGCMHLVAPQAGVLAWQVPVGSWVSAGQTVAELIDPISAECVPLRSPVDGLLFARELQRWARSGQSVAKVAGAQPLRTGKLLSA